GADLLSFMVVLTDYLKCCGLVIRCVKDKRMYSSKDQQDHFTHLGWEVYEPRAERLISPTRLVSLSQYYGKWRFTQSGDPLPGEEVAQYKATPVQRKLTLDSVSAFSQSLGLSPFAPSFYLSHSCLVTIRGTTTYTVSRSLVEAQAV